MPKNKLKEKTKKTILISHFSTPIGAMHIAATDAGICFLEFDKKAEGELDIEAFMRSFQTDVQKGENEHIMQAKTELEEYFAGSRKHFKVALDSRGTDFQKQVWDALLEIPYGKTASYQEQALKIGNLKAIRAVATANGSNKIAIIVPCHRVIGKNGSLTGYAGGLERKRWLLSHEQQYENGVLSLF